MMSSLVAAYMMRRLDGNDPDAYDRCMEHGLASIVAMARMAYESIEDAIQFLLSYHIDWCIPAHQVDQRLWRETLARIKPLMLDAYHQLPFATTEGVWARWTNPFVRQTPDTEITVRWLRATAGVLARYQRNGLHWRTAEGSRVLSSLIHMHHNRLGITNRDESFIALVAAEALCSKPQA